jgi:NitT/TauT family transport system substrate-binding protein
MIKRLLSLGGSVAVAALLAGCGAGSAPSASTSAAAPASTKPAPSTASVQQLKAMWNTITANQSPTWVAVEAGLYTKHGLKVDLTYAQGSTAALPALLAGEASILETTPVAAVQANIKGADTVVLGYHIPYINQRLMAVPGINSLEDLRGKTVAATKAGSSDDFTLQMVLKQKGLTPNKDVNITYLGDVPGQVAGLSQHLIDAIVVSPPNNLEAEKAGGHQVMSFLDLHIPYPGDGVVSTKPYVNQHRDIVVKYLAAYVEAIQYLKTHPAESKKIFAQYLKLDDQRVLDATYDALVEVLPDNPAPEPAGLQTILSSVDGGQGKDPAAFIDPTPLQEAMRSLGK